MKASFFDIDGTLVEGLMIHEFPKYLAKKGVFENKIFEKIDSLVNLYKKNKATYRQIALEIPGLCSKCLKNISAEEILKEAKSFVDFYLMDNIWPYTKNLVQLMKGYGLMIGISGSPIEVVSYVGEIFNFDITYGTEFEIINGVYTGKVKQNLIIKETKETLLKRTVEKYGIDLNQSFGFGDTEQDLSFLSEVGMPITLNPNSKLMKVAIKNNWLIYTSKDDVAENIKKILK